MRVIAFRETLSGDLLQVIGHGNFTDAMSLLTKRTVAELGRVRVTSVPSRGADARSPKSEESDLNERSAGAFDRVTGPAIGYDNDVEIPPDGFAEEQRLDSDDLRRAIAILIDYFWRHDEVWMGPYLRRLSEEMTHLADFERKAIIGTFTGFGLARAERREGHPNDYSVLILNREHPDVVEAVAESRFA